MEFPNWKTVLIVFMIAAIITIFVVNRTFEWTYGIGACTFNAWNCTEPEQISWDGQCTDEIEDKCCEPVRVCSGQIVDDPLDCYDKYCWQTGQKCIPMTVGETAELKWACTCEGVYV